MISSEQSRRRADGIRAVALAIVAVAPVALVGMVFGSKLNTLYQLQYDTDREVGELAVQMDGIERRLARLETSDVALRQGQEVILRRLETIERAATPRDRMARE